MDIGWSAHEEAFRAEVREWLEANRPPLPIPSGDTYKGVEVARGWERHLFEGRWAVVSWPERYGGRDASLWEWLIFEDDQGKMNVGVADAAGGVLVVSQFTLYGDTSRGRRPSWVAAARPEQAEPLVARFEATLAGLGATVARGRFGAHMHLSLCNDGPVTVTVDA